MRRLLLMSNFTEFTHLANAIRILSADAVQNAKSGHPGMPMGMAEIGAVLWKNHLKHNPKNPKWLNRDRFILSNGHGSMLIYSLLHLTGYSLSINDIKQFRQLHSKTPGHPEYGYTDGVETTTGPLGQGLANGVGMAIAQHLLAQEFNQKYYPIIDHHTYVFVGDGCLMEGISHEVCSLAGTLELNKLIVIYDKNGISIDGDVDGWFNEDVRKRFEAYKWNVIDEVDGHNPSDIDKAITKAKTSTCKPTIIICNTVIGKGSPNKCGREESHGSPLGLDEVAILRKELDWESPPFEIPLDVYHDFDCTTSGNTHENHWNNLFKNYSEKYPDLAHELIRRTEHALPQNFNDIIWDAIIDANTKKENIATRKASQNAITFYAKYLPELLGGSADLTGSNLTNWNQSITLTKNNNFTGNYISYGVREFGMSAIMNGIYLHGGYRPFGGTFLMFSEYARNALRMSSLMKIAPIFVYTHDSIGLGEDGPTHQPVEQIATLRMIPNMDVWRPCDSVEANVAWGMALQNTHTPSSLVFSRQNLPFIERDMTALHDIKRGGYVLRQNLQEKNFIDITIIATGSEVEIAIKCFEWLVSSGKSIQLISMPSTSIFDKQDNEYKKSVIPTNSKYKIAIEAGISATWYKYVGTDGLIIGIDTFGESAPAHDLFNHFKITFEAVKSKITTFIDTDAWKYVHKF